MEFVKHKDSRINLNNVIEYKPSGSNSIRFTTNSSRGKKNLSRRWDFESEEERNKTLDRLDKYTDAGEDFGKNKPARVPIK